MPAVHLGHQTQVTLHVDGTDGRARTLALWIVRVDGDAYVRSLTGVSAWWYRRVTGASAELWCAEGIVRTSFEPVDAATVLDRVDIAYEEKYGLGWPGPVGFLTAPAARRATLRVVVAGADGVAPG